MTTTLRVDDEGADDGNDNGADNGDDDGNDNDALQELSGS